MAIVGTSGTLDNSTASTGTRIALGGKAQWIYVSVQSQTYGYFAPSTASTGTGTGIGLTFATGDHYVFQFQPGEAKYFLHVATGTNSYYIMEIN